jgi:D-alanine-D-alanine ligase
MIGPRVLELCAASDVVFIALHGAMGENGQLQATLDNYGIKYTGSGYDGSLLAMDKELTKRLIAAEGVPSPEGVCGLACEMSAPFVLSKVGLPCVVKPCDCGSSVGVSIVQKESELEAALELAKSFGSRVVVERMIKGREFSVGILDGCALPAIEIIPKEGFYDYKNKYQGGMTLEVCPAELTEEQAKAAAETAQRVFGILRLRGYSRIDLMLDSENGKFYCLEANTLPGMTPTSLLPQEAAAAGISYDELCEKIANLALK